MAMFIEEYGGVVRLLALSGEVLGRNHMQLLAFLAQEMGFPGLKGDFEYRSYGPYSKGLASDLDELVMLGAVTESEYLTPGGYQAYRYALTPAAREHFARIIESANGFASAVESLNQADTRLLELAATIQLFRTLGFNDEAAIDEVKRRKPEQEFQDNECRQALEFLEEIRKEFASVSARV